MRRMLKHEQHTVASFMGRQNLLKDCPENWEAKRGVWPFLFRGKSLDDPAGTSPR